MIGPSYATIYRQAVREATRAEDVIARAWRAEMARKERAAIKRGEVQARDATWQDEPR